MAHTTSSLISASAPLMTRLSHRKSPLQGYETYSSRQPVSPKVLEDSLRPPTNLYTAQAPHTATFLSVKRIGVNPDNKETYHIVFDYGGFLRNWEGQVIGIMPPPPENPFEPGDVTTMRGFFVASSRYGDKYNGKTASLCVAKAGPTSAFLCSAKPGDKLQITGPIREATLLGNHTKTDGIHIMIGTGFGVAPFSSHIRRFFAEDIPNFKFTGLAWLFAGHTSEPNQLYKDEFTGYAKENPHNFRYNVALSREQTNKSGGKMYVQDIFTEHAEEVFGRLNDGAFLYIAGLNGSVDPVEAALRAVAEKNGMDWDNLLMGYKRNDQWRVQINK